jgi:hypothetical protein
MGGGFANPAVKTPGCKYNLSGGLNRARSRHSDKGYTACLSYNAGMANDHALLRQEADIESFSLGVSLVIPG